MTNGIARWNFEADDESVMVCRGQHERSDACEYERLSSHQVLEILNSLRSRVLELEARIKLQ